MYGDTLREAGFGGCQSQEQQAQTERQEGLSEHQETHFYSKDDGVQVAKAGCELFILGDTTNKALGNWLWVILLDQGSWTK